MYIEEIKKYIGKQFTVSSLTNEKRYTINKIIGNTNVEITWDYEGYLSQTLYSIPTVLKYIATKRWLIVNDIKDIEDD